MATQQPETKTNENYRKAMLRTTMEYFGCVKCPESQTNYSGSTMKCVSLRNLRRE